MRPTRFSSPGDPIPANFHRRAPAKRGPRPIRAAKQLGIPPLKCAVQINFKKSVDPSIDSDMVVLPPETGGGGAGRDFNSDRSLI
jgi:hypothetical protein